MGQLDFVNVRRLIETHPNIYFTTSMTDNVEPPGYQGAWGWINMFDDSDRLLADWKQLMIEHPDRFIFATDVKFLENISRRYLPTVARWREAIKESPIEVAHAVAHGNAERLWRLPPSPK